MPSGCGAYRNNVPIRINHHFSGSNDRDAPKTHQATSMRGPTGGQIGVLVDERDKKLLRYDNGELEAQERAFHAAGCQPEG